MVRRHRRLHPAAQDHDLFVLGEYHVDRFLGRFIVLYYGSFELCFGYSSEEELREYYYMNFAIIWSRWPANTIWKLRMRWRYRSIGTRNKYKKT